MERSYLILFCSINRDMFRFNFKNIYNKKQFHFYFYFLNQGFQFTIMFPILYFCILVDNLHLEGIVSQVFSLGPRLYFMSKN